ncbi:hypothetical protein ES703_117068 [subsurface metagenome]
MMGLKGHDTRDIFPDFRTYVFPPVSPAWFNPKAWGVHAKWDETGLITDLNATFVTDDVQVGDACYIISPIPTATNIINIYTENHIKAAAAPPLTEHDVLYKVGHGIPHTIQTLASIVGHRAVAHYTLHHGKLWTGVQMPHWATDETGEVYVISHDTGKALWLDGELEIPAGFPGDPPGPPPVPLPIDQWEDRFPGLPRPDYPPGLEHWSKNMARYLLHTTLNRRLKNEPGRRPLRISQARKYRATLSAARPGRTPTTTWRLLLCGNGFLELIALCTSSPPPPAYSSPWALHSTPTTKPKMRLTRK